MIKFYSKSKEGKCLSNFADYSVILDDRFYLTGEHVFHGNKYLYLSTQTEDQTRQKTVD